MANVTGYRQIILPDGRPGTVITYDNGLVQTVDENHDVVDTQYGGATPLAPMPETTHAYDLTSGWNNLQPPVAPPPVARGGYSDPQPSGGGGGNPFSARTPSFTFGTAPSYHDGSTHPLMGGQPRVAGGTWRGPGGGDGGYDNREQVFVPGGASAGPLETSAASNWPEHVHRASFGGGGSRHPMYSALRARGQAMASKVRGMASGIGGGGGYGSGGSYGGTGNAAYARQQHRYNQQARQQQRAYEDGSYLYDTYKMRGFSKKMDPQQAEGLMFRPSMLLPKVAPGVSSTSPRYGQLADLPAAQLSMLRYGANGKAKPGPSEYVNNLAKFYAGAAEGDLPSYDQLTHNLATAKNKSALGQMFKRQPLGYAADSYESMVTSIFGSTGLDPRVAAARTEVAQGLIDEYGTRFLKKPAKKATPINRWVASKTDML